MKPKRYKWLADTINKEGYQIGAEIGVATGNTTEYVLKNCPKIEKYLVVDIWKKIPESPQWNRDDMEQFFRNKFKKEKRLEIIKSISWEGAKYVNEEMLDFVFIDAAHDKESVIKDLTAWAPKVREGGMVSGHDTHFPGVIEALKELKIPYVETGVDHCWVWKK